MSFKVLGQSILGLINLTALYLSTLQALHLKLWCLILYLYLNTEPFRLSHHISMIGSIELVTPTKERKQKFKSIYAKVDTDMQFSLVHTSTSQNQKGSLKSKHLNKRTRAYPSKSFNLSNRSSPYFTSLSGSKSSANAVPLLTPLSSSVAVT